MKIDKSNLFLIYKYNKIEGGKTSVKSGGKTYYPVAYVYEKEEDLGRKIDEFKKSGYSIVHRKVYKEGAIKSKKTYLGYSTIYVSLPTGWKADFDKKIKSKKEMKHPLDTIRGAREKVYAAFKKNALRYKGNFREYRRNQMEQDEWYDVFKKMGPLGRKFFKYFDEVGTSPDDKTMKVIQKAERDVFGRVC